MAPKSKLFTFTVHRLKDNQKPPSTRDDVVNFLIFFVLFKICFGLFRHHQGSNSYITQNYSCTYCS